MRAEGGAAGREAGQGKLNQPQEWLAGPAPGRPFEGCRGWTVGLEVPIERRTKVLFQQGPAFYVQALQGGEFPEEMHFRACKAGFQQECSLERG